MKVLAIFLFLVICVIGSLAEDEPVCGDNERVGCKPCEEEECRHFDPVNPKPQVSCKIEKCTKVCVCNANFVRREIGKECIKPEACVFN